MTKGKFGGLLATLGFAAQFANGQLESDCNPLHADCPAKKAWPHDNYYIDFTKETGPPENWIIANNEVVKFTPMGAEFTYGKKGDSPNMWTDFYMLGGRYDVEMQIAPGQGVISTSILSSDTQDEIDWEFSGNQHGEKPFPPPDGMWTVETNIFAQSKMWDGAVTYHNDAYYPTTRFHTYSVEWDEGHVNWFIDNKMVRSVQKSKVPSGFNLPQSPMKLQLGVWGGGEPGNNHWTVEWAGGEIDMKGVPYTMYVRSVKITNKSPACQYKYKDKSGRFASIDQIQGDCGSLTGAASSANSPKEIRGIKAYSTLPETASASNTMPAGSPSSSSPGGYVVSTHSTLAASPSSHSYPVASASSSSTHQAASASSAGSYPVVSSSSSSHPVASSSSSGSHPSASASSPGSYPVASASSSSTHQAASASSAGSYPVASSSSSSHPVASSSSSSHPVASSSSSSSHPSASASSPGSYPVASSSSSNHPVASSSRAGSYPVASSSSSSSHLSASASNPGSYPVASSSSSSSHPAASTSSTGGLLSSLSSYLMGTSSYSLPLTSTGTFSVNSDASAVTSSTTPKSSGVKTGTPSPYPTSAISVSPVLSSTPSNPSSATSSGSGSSFFSYPSGASSSSPASSSSARAVSSSLSLTSQPPPPTTSRPAMPSTYSFSSEITTSILSTVYSTNTVTIASCAPSVKNCPVGQITTETVSLYTTLCSVTHTVIDGTTFSGQASPVQSTAVSASSIPTYGFSSLIPSQSVSSSSPTTSLAPSAGQSSTKTQSGPSSYGQLSSTTVKMTTSTVYSTSIYTITSCEPTVTNCPASLGQVTTELVSLYTTVCPVKETLTVSTAPSSPSTSGASSTGAHTASPSSSATTTPVAPSYTTSTVYSTSVYTVSSCAPGATGCSSQIGALTTDIIAVSTTVCPVTDKHTPAGTASAPQITPSSYTTAEVTLSNTVSNSVIVITSVITFVDTPAPNTPTASSGTAAVSSPSGSHPGTKQPCTTLTLGNHFTTVITYASIPQLSSATSHVDSPSSTTSNVGATIGTSPSRSDGKPVHETPFGVPGHPGGCDHCVCQPSTVYNTVTVTIARTTVTNTKTIEPPFPSSYGTGSGVLPAGTGTSDQLPNSSAMPTGTGAPMRRWFRRPHGGYGHGHGHGHH